jgi:hypothetical protein
MEWTDPDEETAYADQGEIEEGAGVLLHRLERMAFSAGHNRTM